MEGWSNGVLGCPKKQYSNTPLIHYPSSAPVWRRFCWHLDCFGIDSLMLNRALFAVAGFASLCFAFCPSELRAVDPLNFDGITLAQPFAFPQSLSLDDRQTFFFSSSFGWMEPTQDFLPTFKPAQPRSSP